MILARRRTSAALVLASAVALAGCGGGDDGGGSSAAPPATVTDGTVNMSIEGPVTSYDPAKSGSFQDATVAWALYDALVTFAPNGSIVGDLASEWSTTPTTATFTLKEGVTCSDGSPLTADVAAASITRFLAPETASPMRAGVLGPDNNAAATANGNVITVTMDKPYSGLLAGLATPFAGIVCAAGQADPESLKTSSSGTGAYVSDSQVTGSSYTLRAREGYAWGPQFSGAPTGTTPQTLVMKVVADESTRANLMSTGELQIAGYRGQVWSRFKGAENVSSLSSDQSESMLLFNEAPGHPTADPAIRKAIAQAVDRAQLNAVQSNGTGKVLDSLGQSTFACYSSLEDNVIDYDATAAAQVLKGVSLKLIGSNVAAGGDNNSYVQSVLQEAGAKVTLENLDAAAWVSELYSGTGDWDVTLYITTTITQNTSSTGDIFVGPAAPEGRNFGVVNNAEATAQVNVANTTTGDDQCAATAAFQKALFENADVQPLATIPVENVFTAGTGAVVVNGFVQPSTIRIAG